MYVGAASMASCCVIREEFGFTHYWLQSVPHAVRASRSWRFRVARSWRTCPSWATVASVRACTSAPLPSAAHRCTRPSRQVCTHEATWRCGGRATVGHRLAPPESRNGLLMAMWKDGVQTSRGGSAGLRLAGWRARLEAQSSSFPGGWGQT